MTKSQKWQWIPTSLSFEQFQQFVLPHLSTGSRGPAPKLPLHRVFNTSYKRFTWAVSGRNCRSKKIMKAVRKFITRASTARFEGGKRTAALTPFLQVRWQRFIKPIFSTLLSSMAMVRRLRRRKAATTSVSVGTRRSRATRSSPSAIAIAMSSRRLFRRLAIAMNRRYCEKLCRW